ncbi:hypothetical protein PWT90_06603 [Aphanocladium album]|nr:hypothetical protein PWT90_06603 [Aphanocladium album]
MKASAVFVCLAAAAVAAPTQIIMSQSDDTSSSGLKTGRIEKSIGHSFVDVVETVHAVPDPADGSLTMWECSEQSLFGTAIRCKKSTFDEAHPSSVLEGLLLSVAALAAFLTVWLFETNHEVEQYDIVGVEVVLTLVDEKTSNPV